ncbi:MAG: hypothetical protein FJ116_03395 [Deltaproteobacteria bacterium]|nr:hypothetical protein [Deltaproteobacteria bacterium]MBM4316509.1 hypothetical protein [Deltaproteobacteria bacterium]
MKRVFLAFLFILSPNAWNLVAVDCGPKEVAAADPFSGTRQCLVKAEKFAITVVSESNCGPCHLLLKELRKLIPFEFPNLKIRILWTDPDRLTCMSSAMRFSSVGENFCLSEAEAKARWQITGTPTVFWQEGSNLRQAQGVIERNAWRENLKKLSKGLSRAKRVVPAPLK